MSRRELGRGLATLLPGYALLHLLFERDLFARSVRGEAYRWLAEVQETSRGLLDHRLRPRDWQSAVLRLFGGIELPEIHRLVDLDRLAAEMDRPFDRASARTIALPPVEGLPERAAFATKVFALRKGVAIVPHGHRNMVSMHLVLAGELRLRHFDRLQDEDDTILLRPTIDRISRPGDLSSISSEKDNVHWFVAKSEPAFTLDVIVDNLDPRLGFPYRMDYVDPRHGEQTRDGAIRARRISFEEALVLYGPGGIP